MLTKLNLHTMTIMLREIQMHYECFATIQIIKITFVTILNN